MAIRAKPFYERTTKLVVTQSKINVVHNEEVKVAIVIDISKGTTAAPGREADTRFLRDINEGSVTTIVIKHIRAKVGQVEILPPVVVIIGGTSAHPVSSVLQARVFSHVAKRSITVVAIQGVVA